jgi:hypothetical protein
MSVGHRIERVHWRAFNVAWRVVGLLFLPVALGFLAWGLWVLVHPAATIAIDGVPRRDPGAKLMMLALPVPHLALGIYALRRRTYRPDLGDRLWFVDPMAAKFEQSGRRSWWTGDPLPKVDPRASAA